jgi:hypothetical protein
MLDSLQKARKSTIWRAIHDSLAFKECLAILVAAVSAIGAWAHHEPFHIVFFWFVATSAVASVALHYGFKIWFTLATKQEKKNTPTVTAPPPHPEPNLIARSLLYKTLEQRDGRWTSSSRLDQISYRAQLLEIMNAPTPGKNVSDATELSAQVVVMMNGQELCSGSPAPWEDEPLNKVTIPLGRSKNIVLVVRQGTSMIQGGFWEVVSDGRDNKTSPSSPTITTIPYQYEGRLWVRILHGGKIVQTERFTWARNLETGDFTIRPA